VGNPREDDLTCPDNLPFEAVPDGGNIGLVALAENDQRWRSDLAEAMNR
jgi:hypothetical protein